jgi:hypothetical protein
LIEDDLGAVKIVCQKIKKLTFAFDPACNRYISYAEARVALQQATEDGREHAIWFLTNIVRDLKGWKKIGKPFIQQAWPRERKFQTSASSRNFAHFAEEARRHGNGCRP